MTPSIRLGGFKLLREMVWISVARSGNDRCCLAELSHLLAREKTNLPFLTCGSEDREWGLDLVIDSHDAEKTAGLIENNFRKTNSSAERAAILSIFPHRGKPETLGALLHAFGKAGVAPAAIANSPSSISVVLREDAINKATNALFGPFNFSAYRSPSDWKLAQKGKEKLYKEVVASYQERKPKVYALEWEGEQDLLQVKIKKDNLQAVGEAFKGLSQLDFPLTFLITTPSKEDAATNLLFCIPHSDMPESAEILKGLPDGTVGPRVPRVASFSMNGPHFGDRYGIANELLTTLEEVPVRLLGLSCSIASISGVVPAEQIHSTLLAIQRCFEVPSVTNKTRV